VTGGGPSRLDETHDPARTSFVPGANAPDADFPIQNLPYGVFSRPGGAARHVGVAIGGMILDLTVLEEAGFLRADEAPVFNAGTLEPFMALGPAAWTATRRTLATLLAEGEGEGEGTLAASPVAEAALVPQNGAALHLPFTVAGFTDFYSSREHAETVGTIFRGAGNALPPNWLHMPIAYNGRASTVIVSGTPVRRPLGQLRGEGDLPRLAPSARLDYELELGAVIGTPSAMGTPVSPATASGMIFGFVLLNDWSARDIQLWEYRPLGPFQSKAFATTISPWVVTRAALEPFRVGAPAREAPLLDYLNEATANHYDIALEVALGAGGAPPQAVARTNARRLYFSAAQQVAHHTLCGCAMRTGDLLGSGTISGPTDDSRGSLLEATWNGERPIAVAGATRTFLEDGDTVVLSGWCEGARRIGFGTASGTILPAPPA